MATNDTTSNETETETWTWEAWNAAIAAAMAAAPAQFATEADYRAYCEATGAQPLDRYAALYGQFDRHTYAPSWVIGQRLYYRIAPPQPRQAETIQPTATCPGCGITGNPRVWSSAAGYGPCCPDCYDRLSE